MNEEGEREREVPEFSVNSEPVGTTASKWSVCLVSLRTVDSLLSTGVGAWEEFFLYSKDTVRVCTCHCFRAEPSIPFKPVTRGSPVFPPNGTL